MSGNENKMRQFIGGSIIGIVLFCTAIAACGVWGLVEEDVAWRLFATLVVAATGLGVSGAMFDRYFKEKV